MRGVLGVLILLSCILTSFAEPTQQIVREPYLVRGQEITVLFDEYEQTLDLLFDYLSESLQDLDSVLYEKVLAAQYAKEKDGYQIVPNIRPVTVKPPKIHSRPRPAHFNWQICEREIRDELIKLGDINKTLSARSVSLSLSHDDSILELASKFIAHKKTWRKVQGWIKYNQVWQGKVASKNNEAWYRDRSKMIDQVILRYDLNELLSIEDDQLFFSLASDLGVLDTSTKRNEIEKIARAKIADSNQAISIRTRLPKLQAYVKVHKVSDNKTELIVPVHTDIVDEKFLSRFVDIVESNWRARIDNHDFQIRVDVLHITTAKLYGSDPMPLDGQKIKVKDHASHFPDGAALTTGGKATHSVGNVIFLGPMEVSENTLVHEFGHFLGFEDRYFRGYKDLGDDGYDLFELGSNPYDIMSHPGSGKVLSEHFLEMMDSIQRFEVANLINQSMDFYQQGKYEQSLKAAEKALLADPVNAIAFNNICVANIKLKKFYLAISACEKSVSLNTDENLYQNNLNWAKKEKKEHERSNYEQEN